MDNRGIQKLIIVKALYQDEIRALELPSPYRIGILSESVRKIYSIPSHVALRLSHLDLEGDFITLSSDTELDLAIRRGPVPLRINVAHKDKPKEVSLPKEEESQKRKIEAAAAPVNQNNGGGPQLSSSPPTPRNLQLWPEEVSALTAPQRSQLLVAACESLSSKSSPSVKLAPSELATALQLLRLRPRSLVTKGLAPLGLLRPFRPGQSNVTVQTLLQEEIAAEREQDRQSEGNGDEEWIKDAESGTRLWEMLVSPFVSAGVPLSATTVKSFLIAMNLKPVLMVRLGLVDRERLRSHVVEDRKKARLTGGPDPKVRDSRWGPTSQQPNSQYQAPKADISVPLQGQPQATPAAAMPTAPTQPAQAQQLWGPGASSQAYDPAQAAWSSTQTQDVSGSTAGHVDSYAGDWGQAAGAQPQQQPQQQQAQVWDPTLQQWITPPVYGAYPYQAPAAYPPQYSGYQQGPQGYQGQGGGGYS